MKNILSSIIVIVIIIGLTIFIQHKFFPTRIVETTHTTDTIWQDSIQIVYKPKPYPVYVEIIKTDTITLPVDSTAIAEAYLELYRDYYSTYFYTDTLQNDTLGLAILDAEISQNKPQNYTFSYFNRIPSIINNTTNIYAQNEFYIGLNNAAPSILFKHKNGWMIGGGYDLINDKERIRIQGYYNLNKILKR